jgi:hypothetical protein
MRTTHRSYSEGAGDFARLCRLAVELRGEPWRLATWCLGRVVDWRYALYGGKLDAPGFWAQSAHLWLDGFGDLAAVALSESGDAGIAVLTAPGQRWLFGEALDWALDAWAGRGPAYVELTEAQELEASALERRGFVADAPYLARRFDLALLPEAAPALEPGFALVDMVCSPDYRGRRLLRANAFGGRDDLGEEELRYELQLDTYGLGSPIYHPACDLCVQAPDGRLVAGC